MPKAHLRTPSLDHYVLPECPGAPAFPEVVTLPSTLPVLYSSGSCPMAVSLRNTYTRTHIHICTRAHRYMHAYAHKHTHVHTCRCTYACTHMHTMFTCTHTRALLHLPPPSRSSRISRRLSQAPHWLSKPWQSTFHHKFPFLGAFRHPVNVMICTLLPK